MAGKATQGESNVQGKISKENGSDWNNPYYMHVLC